MDIVRSIDNVLILFVKMLATTLIVVHTEHVSFAIDWQLAAALPASKIKAV